MIRKFARINAPVPTLTGIFADTDRWPLWMSGVETATSVRSTDDLEIVDLEIRTMGRKLEQRIECRVTGSTVRMEQISGFLKKWNSVWNFSPAPGDAGTTVSLELDFDLGMMGMVVPARAIQSEIDRAFDETVEGAKREVLAKIAARDAGGEQPGETVLEIWETRTGFEVLVAGRRLEVGKSN